MSLWNSLTAGGTSVLDLVATQDQANSLSIKERQVRMILLENQLKFLREAEAVDQLKGRVLKSPHFTDDEIFRQVMAKKFQLPLSSHNWEILKTKGPCFVELSMRAILALEKPAGLSDEQAIHLACQQVIQDPTNSLNSELRDHLVKNMDALLEAIRVVGESYLARSLPAKSSSEEAEAVEGGGAVDGKLPDHLTSLHLKGELGTYHPRKFLAKGSAGIVYTALMIAEKESIADKWRLATSKSQAGEVEQKDSTGKVVRLRKGSSLNPLRNWNAQVVLKKIKPTQRDSAENEYRIARKLAADGGNRYCVAYMDRIQDSNDDLWLVLRRVQPSDYGISLTEYIELGFFQMEGHEEHSQKMVTRILTGVEHMASKGVIMRDVKADNILVEKNSRFGVSDQEDEKYIARWSDFGLAVDVSLEGDNLRRPKTGSTKDVLVTELVGWWYDTQKQVPKSTWVNRIPPERSFQMNGVHIAAYDMYMTGVIFCSMAFGIDFAHLNKPAIQKEVQEKLDIVLDEDFLSTFELGNELKKSRTRFVEAFVNTFGKAFGLELIMWTEMMLEKDPVVRPIPSEVLRGNQELKGLIRLLGTNVPKDFNGANPAPMSPLFSFVKALTITSAFLATVNLLSAE